MLSLLIINVVIDDIDTAIGVVIDGINSVIDVVSGDYRCCNRWH